ncbi:hypothetical protein L3V82_08655 [Thiotrichales bacterium 19S3-7]|nr:hypothetical protein [Thiotrichales bacterium 19S3-7]MCF6802211.1 hypothetical protein [Thiotrichales bacterium 19S3-11]
MDKDELINLLFTLFKKVGYKGIQSVINRAADKTKDEHLGLGFLMTESSKEAIAVTIKAKTLMNQVGEDYNNLWEALKLLAGQGHWQGKEYYWWYSSFNTKFVGNLVEEAARELRQPLLANKLQMKKAEIQLIAEEVYLEFICGMTRDKINQVKYELTDEGFNPDVGGLLLASALNTQEFDIKDLVINAAETALLQHKGWGVIQSSSDAKKYEDVNSILNDIKNHKDERPLMFHIMKLMKQGDWNYGKWTMMMNEATPSFNTYFMCNLIKLVAQSFGYNGYVGEIEKNTKKLMMDAQEIFIAFQKYALSNTKIELEPVESGHKLEDFREAMLKRSSQHEIGDVKQKEVDLLGSGGLDASTSQGKPLSPKPVISQTEHLGDLIDVTVDHQKKGKLNEEPKTVLGQQPPSVMLREDSGRLTKSLDSAEFPH